MKKISFFTMFFLLISTTYVFANDFELYQNSGDKSEKWDQIVEAGFVAYEAEDYETALIFLQKALSMGCNDGILFFKLGLYFELNKEYDKTAMYFEKASSKLLKQYPNYIETKKIHEHLGRVYYLLDKYDKALKHLNLALKNDPNNFMALFMSAQIYRIQKEHAKAIPVFEKTLILTKEIGKKLIIVNELMALYYEIGDFDNSQRYAELILSIDPSNKVAASYLQTIKQIRFEKQQEEMLKKIGE